MSKRTRHLIYAVLLATAITLICASGVLRTADLWVNDLLYQREIYVDNDIVIIGIDDKDIKNFGPYSSWNRSVVARALEVLGSDPENAPAVVAIDIQYSGRMDDEGDLRLAKAAEKLGKVEGIGEVDDGIDNPSPELKITVNKEKAMLNGLTVAQVFGDIAKSLSDSSKATTITTNGKDFDIIVEKGEEGSITKDNIKDYKFKIVDMAAAGNTDETAAFDMAEEKDENEDEEKEEEPKKEEVALSEIAEIEETTTLSAISRRDHKRYITVSGTIADGYNVGLVSRDAESQFENFELPDGFTLEFDGENETIMESMKQLGLMLALAVVLIYLIMVAQFHSLKSPFIVMFTMPLAFTGGFLALIITGKELSVIGLLGFVMLSGIVVNNGIVLVDYINQLRLEGMEKCEAIAEAGATRLRPILMTAITTILGLIMMAVGKEMGSDMVQPIAVVTIGGLVYATFTTLFIIPIIYDIFNKKEMKKIDNSELEFIDD